MKKLDYGIARSLLTITGIIFFTQIFVEVVFERKEGWEYTLHFCGGAFAIAVLYSLVLILINARNRKHGHY